MTLGQSLPPRHQLPQDRRRKKPGGWDSGWGKWGPAGPEGNGRRGEAGAGQAGAAHSPSATWQALRSWECWGRFTSLSARIFSRARDTNMLLVWLSCMAPAGGGRQPRKPAARASRRARLRDQASRPALAASVRAALSGRDGPAPRRRHVEARHVTT